MISAQSVRSLLSVRETHSSITVIGHGLSGLLSYGDMVVVSLLNRFRTGQGHCNTCHKKWGFTDNELCDCGEIQTMSHIVNFCPLTNFDGGLLRLHEADEAAVD